MLGLFLVLGYDNTWRIWNIPVKQPAFYDLRLITGGAESFTQGYNPAVNNPYDPEQRLFNYPRIWYLILTMGIDQRDTITLGIILALAFFISLVTIRGEFDRKTAIVLALVIFSPAVLLGIERGNVDLAVFVLLAIALFSVDLSKTLSLLVLLLAMVFKIYPVLGIGYLLDEEKRSFKYTIAGFVVTVVYMLFNLEDMLHIFIDTQKGSDVSYGVSVLPAKLSPYLGDTYAVVKLLLYLSAFGLILICSYFAFRNKDRMIAANSNHLRMFRLGTGIYIGTFLLGNNWDYRLMFLIFTLPQIVSWAKNHTGFLALASKISLVALLASVWYLEIWRFTEYAGMAGRAVSFMFDELMNWTLFSGLIYLYINSLPHWLLDMIQSGLSQRFAHKNHEIESGNQSAE